MATTPSSSVEFLQSYTPTADTAVTRVTAMKRRNPRPPKPSFQLIGVFPLQARVTETRPLKQFRDNCCQRVPEENAPQAGTVDPTRSGSRQDELHLLERRAAEEPVRTGERLEDLEVVVALRDEELCGPADRLDRRGEVARLALELRRLERPVREHYGAIEPPEVALGAQRVLHLVGELHVGAARGEPHRLQIVHAAAKQPAFHRVRRKIEFLLPVGDEHDAREMGARGMARKVEPVRVAAEL